MKLFYFNDYQLGVLKGDMSAARLLPRQLV